MLSDLVALGRRLREDGRVPPPGQAYWSDPVRWRLKIRRDDSASSGYSYSLVETEEFSFRPDSGRTSGPVAYPLADYAAYVLGTPEKENGKKDASAEKKHKLFLERLAEISAAVTDQDLKQVVTSFRDALEGGGVVTPGGVKADHWVVVETAGGLLNEGPLFQHPEVASYWLGWLSGEVRKTDSYGECAVTGAEGELVDRIPGKSYFLGRASFLGMDKDSFVSYKGGAAVRNKTSIGLSFEAADLANRALEYLSRSEAHQRRLVYDKDSDLRSVTALLWMDVEETVVVETADGPRELAPNDMIAALNASVDTFGTDRKAPTADLRDVHAMLRAPWIGKRTGLDFDAADVHLAVLSKNAYRVVVRDYRTETLAEVKRHLAGFLQAASLAAPDKRGHVRDPRAVPVHEMLRTTYGIADDKGKVRASATKSTNHARALFRTAYFGAAPPSATLHPALARVRTLMTKGDDASRPFRLHALLSLVKLLLTHQTDDAMTLEHLDPARNERAYLCGRLLAVLGRIQQDALTDDNTKGKGGATLNRTTTERYFASASLAPSAYLGTLVQRATTAHIPKLPKKSKDGSYKKSQTWADKRLTSIQSRIHDLGGYPNTLDLRGQGEFALGYYHQRAQFYGGGGAAEGKASTLETPAEPTDLFTPAS